MLTAVKGNKVYDIEKEQAEAYSAQGFDIWDGGKLVKRSPLKTVTYSKYDEALAEIDRLKKELAKAKRTARETKAAE